MFRIPQQIRWIALALISAALLGDVANGQVRSAGRQAQSDRQRLNDEFRMAAGFYEREQWSESVAAMQAFINRFPNSAEAKVAFFYLGESHLQLGDLPRARGAYQTFILANQGHSLQERAVFRVAEIMVRLNDPQATRLLQNFLRTYPQSEWREYALLFLGNRHLQMRELESALKIFEIALRESPQGPLADNMRFGLASAMQGLGQLDDAARFFAMLVDAEDFEMRSQARLRKGRISLDRQEIEQAELLFDQLLADNLSESLRAEVLFFKSRAKIQFDESAAAELIEKSLALGLAHEWQSVALFELARIAFERGDSASLERHTRTLIESHPGSEFIGPVIQLNTRNLFDSKKYEEVISFVSQHRERFSDWQDQPVIGELLGRALYAKERHSLAANVFKKLIAGNKDADNDQKNTWRYFLAASLLGGGALDEAKQVIRSLNWDALPVQAATSWHLLAAHVEMAAQDYEQAFNHYESVLKHEPSAEESVSARDGMLKIRIMQGQSADVAQIIEEHFPDQQPETLTPSLLGLANSALKSKDYRTAERLFGIISHLEPPSQYRADGLAGLGWIAFEQNETTKAVEWFQQTLVEFPDYPRRSELQMTLGRIAEQNSDWEGAAKWYAQAAENSNERQHIYSATYKRALALRKTGVANHLKVARELLTELARQSEAEGLRVYVLYELSWLLQQAGRAAEAQIYLEEIFESYPNSTVWPDVALRVAQFRFSEGRFNDSGQVLAKLVDDHRSHEVSIRARMLSGQIAVQEKRWEDAAKLMSQVAKESTESTVRNQAQYWLAEALYQQNDFAAAFPAFYSLSKTKGSPSLKLAPWIDLRAGQCAIHLGDWQVAFELGNSGQTNYPDFDRVYEFIFLQGRAEFAKGDLDSAKQTFQRVIDLPGSRKTETAAQSQWRIGEALFLQEKYADAVAAYYRVDSLHDFPHWRAAAMLQAGKCQEKLRNYRQAMTLYSNLLKKFPDSEFAEQARKRLSALERQVRVDRGDKTLFR
ncbi:MAG: tetratricopeptide repeat protein [Pirellulaceae bacterium]|nr:tetratricopeptide repeat protein [Pirellulaceae bacterium]